MKQQTMTEFMIELNGKLERNGSGKCLDCGKVLNRKTTWLNGRCPKCRTKRGMRKSGNV